MDDNHVTRRAFTVEMAEAGQRLDRVLAARLPDLSRSRLQALIEDGHVTLDRGPAKPAHKLKGGEAVEVVVPVAVAATPRAEALPLDVVYEDDDLIIINKPAGLVVHPGAGNAEHTLVNALIHHCGASLSGIGGVRRPGIVHRIDKETSGLLVAAKNDLAHHGLAAQFAAHDLERAYLAIVWGAPTPPAGRIAGNIGRHPIQRQKMTVRATGGKMAITHYRTLKRFDCAGKAAAALVECRLQTGRTHQIRVHMTHVGHPLIGDAVYGRATRHGRGLPEGLKRLLAAFPRQALHAASLGFRHPRTSKALKFSAELPHDMTALLNELEKFK